MHLEDRIVATAIGAQISFQVDRLARIVKRQSAG
jgi:hypothetical protein